MVAALEKGPFPEGAVSEADWGESPARQNNEQDCNFRGCEKEFQKSVDIATENV